MVFIIGKRCLYEKVIFKLWRMEYRFIYMIYSRDMLVFLEIIVMEMIECLFVYFEIVF